MTVANAILQLSNGIGKIIVDDDHDGSTSDRDIKTNYRNYGGLQQISALHGAYTPLHNVLFSDSSRTELQQCRCGDLPMTKRRVKNAISIMWLFYTETEDQINIFDAILSVYASFTSIRIAFAPDRTSAARMLFNALVCIEQIRS